MSESRHLRSVSDLYAADEIEVLLLEEIRELDPPPAAYSRPEDIQDFEIAGSRTGGRISSPSSELDSPGIHSTVHSWDSHENYHGDYGNGDHRHGSSANSWPRAGHLIFYCDIQGHLKTATGLIRLLLLVSSAACLATLCSSGTAKVSLFMLPLVGRLRFMIFVAVFCLLITSLLLFLDISHVVYFFPFNWPRVNAWIFTSVGISYMAGSALLILSILEYHGGGWVPKSTKSQLSATVGLGLACALLSFLLSWLHGRTNGFCCHRSSSNDSATEQLYKPVDNSSSSTGATLKDRSTKQPPSWVSKNQSSKRRQSSVDTNNGDRPYGRNNRKDHWATTRQPSTDVPEEDNKPAQATATTTTARRQRMTKQQRQDTANGEEAAATTGTTTGVKKKAPPKKLALQGSTDKPTGRPRPSKDGGKKTTSTRTSVTRSEIQEYWMQGYEHVQRTEKTTGNIEQWQSAAMKSLQEKKERDALWASKWKQPAEDEAAKAKPCSSKTLEPFGFA